MASMIHKLLEISGHKQVGKQHGKKRQNNSNLNACRKKLRYGHYTAAIRAISSGGVAPFNEDTLNELRLKHSQAPPPIIPPDVVATKASFVTSENVLYALKVSLKGHLMAEMD